VLNTTLRAVRKESAWVVSNISGGSPDHIACLINNSFLEPLLHMLNHAPFDIKKEVPSIAALTIAHFHDIQHVYHIGCVCDRQYRFGKGVSHPSG